MKPTIALLATLYLVGCSATRDTRLDGTWVSDRDATVAHARTLDPNRDLEKYSQIFGHLRITYDAETVTTDFKGRIERWPLRLVRKDSDSVTARVWDDLDGKYRVLTTHFVDSNTYWIQIRDTEHREYFRRLERNAETLP